MGEYFVFKDIEVKFVLFEYYIYNFLMFVVGIKIVGLVGLCYIKIIDGLFFVVLLKNYVGF